MEIRGFKQRIRRERGADIRDRFLQKWDEAGAFVFHRAGILRRQGAVLVLLLASAAFALNRKCLYLI